MSIDMSELCKCKYPEDLECPNFKFCLEIGELKAQVEKADALAKAVAEFKKTGRYEAQLKMHKVLATYQGEET